MSCVVSVGDWTMRVGGKRTLLTIIVVLAPLFGHVSSTKTPQQTTSADDVRALLQVRNDLGLRHLGWGDGDPCYDNWVGVGCTTNTSSSPPRVTSLNLTASGLKGSIPASIGNLTALITLDLSNNSFTGTLPVEITRNRPLLYVHLSNNYIVDPVPIEYYYEGYATLDLRGNCVDVCYPDCFECQGYCPPMDNNKCWNYYRKRTPQKEVNALLDIKKLASDICYYYEPQISPYSNDMRTWRGDPCRNNWVGVRCKGFDPVVTLLSIQNCTLLNGDGLLPDTMGDLTHLTDLIIYNNILDSDIPESLATIQTLNYVDLSTNYLNSAIPAGFTTLPNLKYLDLSNNFFTDPVAKFDLSSIAVVDMTFNCWKSCNYKYCSMSDNEIKEQNARCDIFYGLVSAPQPPPPVGCKIAPLPPSPKRTSPALPKKKSPPHPKTYSNERRSMTQGRSGTKTRTKKPPLPLAKKKKPPPSPKKKNLPPSPKRKNPPPSPKKKPPPPSPKKKNPPPPKKRAPPPPKGGTIINCPPPPRKRTPPPAIKKSPSPPPPAKGTKRPPPKRKPPPPSKRKSSPPPKARKSPPQKGKSINLKRKSPPPKRKSPPPKRKSPHPKGSQPKSKKA